jgi:hypothetical protein
VLGVVAFGVWAVRKEAADERAAWLSRLPTSATHGSGHPAVGAFSR